MEKSEAPRTGFPTHQDGGRAALQTPGGVVCTPSSPGSTCWLCGCLLLLTDHRWLPIAFIPKSAFLKTSITGPPPTTATPKGTPFSRTVPPSPPTHCLEATWFPPLLRSPPSAPGPLLCSRSSSMPTSSTEAVSLLPSVVTNLPLPNPWGPWDSLLRYAGPSWAAAQAGFTIYQ